MSPEQPSLEILNMFIKCLNVAKAKNTRRIDFEISNEFKERIEPIKEFPPYITILEKISKNFDSMSEILESIIKAHD